MIRRFGIGGAEVGDDLLEEESAECFAGRGNQHWEEGLEKTATQILAR